MIESALFMYVDKKERKKNIWPKRSFCVFIGVWRQSIKHTQNFFWSKVLLFFINVHEKKFSIISGFFFSFLIKLFHQSVMTNENSKSPHQKFRKSPLILFFFKN